MGHEERTMRGAETEAARDNPQVHAKGDLHGMGRKAPHMSHPGETAAVTGTHHSGHNENGHMHAKEVGSRGSGRVTHHEPGKLGSGMAEGHSYAREPVMHQTDHDGHHKVRTVSHGELGSMGQAAGDNMPKAESFHGHAKQHPTGPATRLGSEAKRHENRSHDGNRITHGSNKRDSGALAGESGPRTHYTGGRGKIR